MGCAGCRKDTMAPPGWQEVKKRHMAADDVEEGVVRGRRVEVLAAESEGGDVRPGGLEHGSHPVQVRLLDRSVLAEAGVVDQGADLAMLGLDRLHGVDHRVLRVHVQGQGATAQLLEVGPLLQDVRR